jgi:hypothetical protein
MKIKKSTISKLEKIKYVLAFTLLVHFAFCLTFLSLSFPMLVDQTVQIRTIELNSLTLFVLFALFVFGLIGLYAYSKFDKQLKIYKDLTEDQQIVNLKQFFSLHEKKEVR